jgi:CPA1 family monovalent cation:H+ antiporter
MNMQEIITLTIGLTALFAWLNNRILKWPAAIGMAGLSLLFSIFLLTVGHSRSILSQKVIQLTASVDFRDLLMNFMLSFLLFAGAINIDAAALRRERWPVITLATIATILSTFIVGILAWWLFKAFHFPVPFIHCLLFGALISPTDPIAVLSILKEAKIPGSLELKITGESLFNDGIAVVIFITILQAARPDGLVSLSSITLLFLRQALGGIVFGALLGYAAFFALRSIDDYKVEVLITLAVVMGGYYLAGHLNVSGPLAMVVTGLITGNKTRREAFSDRSKDYLGKFWELTDEILNAILFLFIGLEMLIIPVNLQVLLIGAVCIVICLLARWMSVLVPVSFLRYRLHFEKNAVAILTWGGLRGGISIAMALSLDQTMHRDEFVSTTYIIVLFSILVQGLTIGRITRRLLR